MPRHRAYFAIVEAVDNGRLIEPFSPRDFAIACPEFAKITYYTFLPRHIRGNGKTSELFEKVSYGRYRLLKPLKYIQRI